MHRKDFCINLLLGGTGIFLEHNSLKAARTPARQKIWLATLFIAGFYYYDGPEAESLLQVGMPLQLNRQPHNRYDRNAIEILSGEAKLGYIPRTENKILSELMDEGIELQAEIKELNLDANSNDKVKVEVWYERAINPILRGC